MDEYRGENRIVLRGQGLAAPVPSHRNHGVDYYAVPLRVPRLSGVDDVLNLVTADPDPSLWEPGRWVDAQGEVRSYNNRSGQGSKLVITVLVRSAQPAPEETGENRLVLAGAQAHRPPHPPGPGNLRPAAGRQPALRPGGLPALHRLGFAGRPLRRAGRGRPAAAGGPAPEPPVPQAHRRGAGGAHRL